MSLILVSVGYDRPTPLRCVRLVPLMAPFFLWSNRAPTILAIPERDRAVPQPQTYLWESEPKVPLPTVSFRVDTA